MINCRTLKEEESTVFKRRTSLFCVLNGKYLCYASIAFRGTQGGVWCSGSVQCEGVDCLCATAVKKQHKKTLYNG